MDIVVRLSLLFLVGITPLGLAGSALELAWGQRLTLGGPFVDRRHLMRSLAATLAAGPFMLVNDGLAERSLPGMGLRLALAAAWIFAAGVVCLDLVRAMPDLLT